MPVLVLIETVFVIFWQMFHGRISLNSALLLLLVNFVNGFKLQLMYIYLIINTRSTLTPLHGFQLLVLLPYLFNGPEVLPSASDKAKLFAKKFSENSNFHDSDISLPAFPSRTNLKLHNISVTPKMIKKVIMNLDSSKTSCPDCIPLVVFKNCEFELSCILAELFNMCLKKSCFPDCWKVPSVVSVSKTVGESSAAKNYRPFSLLSVVSKVFEKLINNRLIDHLENCGLFFWFQVWFDRSNKTGDPKEIQMNPKETMNSIRQISYIFSEFFLNFLKTLSHICLQ